MASLSSPLGFSPMDAVHEEFDILLARALADSSNDQSDLDRDLADVTAHLQSHFDAESLWMSESKYPNADCHLQEHAAVLASAHEIAALDSERRRRVARSFFEELANWFPAHAQHLDSALAHWMCKQSLGGKPVVFHAPRRAHSAATKIQETR